MALEDHRTRPDHRFRATAALQLGRKEDPNVADSKSATDSTGNQPSPSIDLGR